MGQYKLSINWNWQIGFLIYFSKYREEITIDLPFITIYIGLMKDASGINFFNKLIKV